MQSTLEVTSGAILKRISKHNYRTSILEYVENGLDAGAKEINIDYTLDPMGAVTGITVQDSGSGIDFGLLRNKFGVFADSQKKRSKFSSSTAGKDGIGRLSFIKFAQNAKWKTVYRNKDGELFGYEIKVERNHPENLEWSEAPVAQPAGVETGTTVEFTGIDGTVSEHTINNDLRKHLLEKISWRLLLTGARLYLKGKLIDPEELVQSDDTKTFEIEGNAFDVRFVKWHEKPKEEESRLYFIDREGKERYKLPTSYNRQGDGFHHSLYIRSNYFDEFVAPSNESGLEDVGEGVGQTMFDVDNETPNPRNAVFKTLRKELNQWIHDIRKPFIIGGAKDYIEDIQASGILVRGESPLDVFLFEQTAEMLEELYLYSPKFLTQQTDDQKAVFVNLVHTVLSEGNTTKVFDILDKVLGLSEEEREQFSKLLEDIELSNIIKTVQLINDRLDVIKVLEQLVFNEKLNANEVKHLQTVISQHYWIFGEEYALIGEAEPDFETNLNRYEYHLRGFSDEKSYMTDPDKHKEMDLFLCKVDRYETSGVARVKNVVVEIKHPSKNLGLKEYTQLTKYRGVISRDSRFNGANTEWRFYLIGRRHDADIDGQLATGRPHGQFVLSKPSDNHTLYYRDWTDVIEENKTRLEFLRRKLEIKQTQIHDRTRIDSADEGLLMLENSAKLDGEVVVPTTGL